MENVPVFGVQEQAKEVNVWAEGNKSYKQIDEEYVSKKHRYRKSTQIGADVLLRDNTDLAVIEFPPR